MDSNPVIGQYLTTTPIIYSNGNHATGFFFRHEETTYLVTNRHALDIETENGEKLQSVKIFIRNDPNNLDETEEHNISLRDPDDSPLWLNEDRRVDLALIPLIPPLVDDSIDILPPGQVEQGKPYEYGNLAFQVEHFPESTPMKITVSGGSGATILGYPLEYFESSFPVARNAIISSPYGRSIENLIGTTANIPKKAFLTDAVTHPGLSGSPVISTPPASIGQNPDVPENVIKAATLMNYDNQMSLLGIHAGEFDKYSDLQLNNAVYPSAIIDMIGPVESQHTMEDFK